MTIDVSLLIVILNFVLLLIILNRLLYQPLKKYFTDRQAQIKNDVETAAKSIEEANKLVAEKDEELKKAYVEARNIKENIRREAETTAENTKQQAIKDGLEKIKQAELHCEEFRRQTMENLESDLADIIMELSGKVLAEKLDPAKDKELILKLLANRG